MVEPELVFPIDNEKYVYAVCKCPLPIGMYGIKIPRIKGQTRYPFKCDKCGTEGEVITKKFIITDDYDMRSEVCGHSNN